MFAKQRIITHRGLNFDCIDFPPESSLEAFHRFLDMGFSLEFDIAFLTDEIIVSHDASADRLMGKGYGKDFSSLAWVDVSPLRYGQNGTGRFPLLTEVFDLISSYPAAFHALHIKGKYQGEDCLRSLIQVLQSYFHILDKLILFDLSVEAARMLKAKIPSLRLAASVSDEFDIVRFNTAASGTLMSINQVLEEKNLFDWGWLDEWDLRGEEGGSKKLYTKENFYALRNAGLKISLVTPELHGTSPGLLGGEAHEDASSKDKLFFRIQEILELSPDAICTDYPETVCSMWERIISTRKPR